MREDDPKTTLGAFLNDGCNRATAVQSEYDLGLGHRTSIFENNSEK